MSKMLMISLVGVGTYATLRTVYQRGTPVSVPEAEAQSLLGLKPPGFPSPLFCLTSDLPTPEQMQNEQALRASGLGELDTAELVVTLGQDSDLSDMSDEDKALLGLDSDDEDLAPTADDPEAPEGATAGADGTAPARKVTIHKGKTVQV